MRTILAGLLCCFAAATHAYELFARTNLVAWCIVPFDAKKRGPEERALMLDRLGLHRFAYDWRAEHIPTFDAEIAACRRHNIEITAWWFPTTLDQDAYAILAALERNKVRTQLWLMGGGGAVKSPEEQKQRVSAEAKRIFAIAQAAGKIGCTVGLYNHGGWFGEPTNQIAIIRDLSKMAVTNVGIVYNFHHGHEHIERFAELFRAMQPHLVCVNINGMVHDGERAGKKILTIGAGDHDLAMLKVVRDSGWRGPVGIIDHRPETDSEVTLRENLRGLESLTRQLDGTRN
ncbi:MAG TPA: TIM barrel protein [Candidatus Limnocylindria bacterium]|nr:TIM barrel protein [Candidatus Limnocylindria bacterium]